MKHIGLLLGLLLILSLFTSTAFAATYGPPTRYDSNWGDQFSGTDWNTGPKSWTSIGAWTEGSGYLISNDNTEKPIWTANTNGTRMSDFNIYFDINMQRAAANPTHRAVFDIASTANDSDKMYRIFCSVSAGCNFGKYDAGGFVLIAASGAGTFTADAWHFLRLTRTTDGNWMLFLDGGLVGSVIDTTWVDANYIFLISFDSAGAKFKDLNVGKINQTLVSANQTFNIYPTGSSVNLAKVDVDCNVDSYDLNNQTSPFTIDMNAGTYSCGFLVNDGSYNTYDRNTVIIVVDSDKTNNIYLTQMSPPWWNDNYKLRKQITITNNSAHRLQDVNNAITINISNQLGANALTNCNDVRIVKGNQTELDRNAVGNCQSDANIWFTLPVSISPNGSDNNYWVYYKNSSASAPTSTTTFPNPARDMNCLGLYRFDGSNTKNECGADATLTGTAGTFATQVRRDGYTFGNTSIVNFGGTISKAAKTIEGWFNCGAACSTADNFISGGNAGADKFTQAYVNGGLQWQLNTDGGGNEFVMTGGTVLQANRWYYIALTCGSQGAKIYVDGNLDASNASTVCFSDIDDALTNFGFGFATTSGNYIFDEGRVLNYQRTSGFWQSDINANAVQPTTLLGAEDSIISWWDNNWAYRQKLTLQTSKIGMSTNVTNDHVILIDINSSNINFWKNTIIDVNEGFEDNSLTTYPIWIVDSGSFVISTDFAYTGTHSLKGTTNGSNVSTALPNISSGINTYTTWMYITGTLNNSQFFTSATTGLGGTHIAVTMQDNGFHCYTTGGADTDMGAAPSTSTWYKLVITYIPGNTKASCYIYDTGGSLLYSTIDQTVAAFTPGYIGFYNDNSGATMYTDNVQWKTIQDVRFVNSNNSSTYSWHIEDVNFDSNRMLAWVGITDVFPSLTDLNLYIYYGNSTAVPDQNYWATYPSTYIHTYHANNVIDYTISNNSLTYGGNTTSILGGKIGKTYTFDGAGDNASNTANTDNNPATFSFCMWGAPNPDVGAGDYYNPGGTTPAAQNSGWMAGQYYNDGTRQINFRIWNPEQTAMNVPFTWGTSFRFACWTLGTTAGRSIYIDTNRVSNRTNETSYTGASAALVLGNDPRSPTSGTDGWAGLIDEIKLFNYELPLNDIKLLYNSENDLNFILFGAQDINSVSIPVYRIDFNVYSAGTTTHLTNITADWNVNTYDVSGQNSPFSEDVNAGVYLVTFSSFGYDNNTNFLVTADSNKTYVIYLTSNYPKYHIDFNVYRTGTTEHLTQVDMDCNNNIYDLNNQTSPFSQDMNQNYVYSCGFLVQQGYDRNTQTIVSDMNKTVVIYLVDTNAPATSVTLNSGSFTTWNNIDGNITLSCTDLNGSGCAQTQYSLDGGGWTTYTPYLLITTDGNHSIDFNSRDNAGNTNVIQTVYYALDKTYPTVTISGNTFATWANTDQTITLTPATTGPSGIALTQYSLDGGVWTNYTVPFTISTDLNHVIDFNTISNAGLSSGIQTSWAAIDKTAPTIGPIFNALEWFAAPFYVIFTQINTGVSGLFHIWQSINGGAYTDANLNGTDSNQLDINAYVPINVDGNFLISLWIRDNAGNDRNITTYGALDQNKPTYSFIDGNGVINISDFNVTVHDVNYFPSEKMFAKYSINSGPFIDTITSDNNENALVTLDGNNSVRFWLRDNAGNDTNIQVYALLDKDSPTYSFVDGNGLPWKNYVFNVTVADVNFGVSGFNFARYQIDSNTGPWLNMSNLVDSNYFVVINQDANHAVYIWLQDGNNHDTNLLVYALSDLNGPIIIRDVNFGLPWRTADFNIRIDVNFAPSGKFLAQYSMDGSPYQDWNFVINDINFLSTIKTDGNHTIRGWFRDNAGNDTNTIGQAYLDKSGPSVGQTVLGPGFNSVGTQIWAVLGNGTILGGAASDPYSDINTLSCEYTINNGATWLPATWNTDHCEKTGVATTPGTFPQYNTRVKDNVGNQGTGIATVVYTVDNVAPVTTDNTDTAWHGGSVTVTLSPTDFVSGVASTTYCVDDLNVCVPVSNYTVPVVVTCPTNGICNRYIRYFSTDIAGNVENTAGSNAIKIDQNRPGVALTTLTGYNISTTFINNNGNIIGGVATDYNGSGLNTATCEYTINNGGAWGAAVWNATHCEKTSAVAIVDGTIYQFNTRISDNVGNVGTGSATIAYTGDTIAPVTTPSGNTFDHWTITPQTITLTCSDAKSGCNSIQYVVDSNGTIFTLNGVGPFVFTLGSDGNHTIDFNSRDNVTNVEIVKRTWAAIDVSAPTLGQTYIETTKISGVQIWGPVHIDATVSDVNGIISFCQYTINNGASWLAADLNATHCYKNGITVTAGTFPQYNLRATNLAGLTGAGTATIVYTADNVAPTVGLTTASFASTYGTGPYYIKGSGTIIGGAATDAVSGIDTATCEYADTNTGAWGAGVWNANHCEKVGWNSGVNGLSYYFNTRVRDQANNLGTGAPSIRYTFDTNGPQVTYTYAQLVPGNPDLNVRLFCLDANSGCKYIWFNVDNTGWNRTNTPSPDFNWFIVSGAGGHSVQYLGTDNLDNNSAALTADLNIAGRLRLRIADENTGLWIPNTTIMFNNTTYTATDGVQFDINLYGLTSGLKTIAFSKALYGTRYYDMDMNAAGNYDVNILLLSSSKGAIIPFTFFMNDGITLAANGFADLNRPDRNGFSIGREALNAQAGALFFVNNSDQNYTQKIISSTGDINYSFPVYLTILFPKDELTLLPIDNNWGFIVLTNTIYAKSDINQFGGDYPAFGGDWNVYLMPNTGVPTVIQISDANGIYFPRLYSKIYEGNPLFDTLQPYLIQYIDGSNITFITTNQLGFAIPGITIEVYKNISNVQTLISSGVTDSSGAYTSSLAITKDYTFQLYINGVKISQDSFNIQIVESKYYFTINTFGYPVDTNSSIPITVLWNPSTEYFYSNASATQNISGPGVNFVKVIAYQYLDSNNTGRSNKFVQWYPCNQSCVISQALVDMIGNGGIDRNLELYIDVNVYYDGNVHMQPFTKAYRLNNNGPVNLMQLFVNAKRSFGCEPTVGSICPWTTILAVLLAIISMGAIMYSLKIFNPFAMAIIGSIVIVFFTIVGWFFWPLLIPFGLLLIFGLFGRRGSE